MLFIFDASGSPLKVVPEKVFQGSNKANTVYFAMPMVAQNNYEVNVQYRLPTGDVLPLARMISHGKIEGVTVDGMPVFAWTIDLTLNVTSFVGQVTMQFFVQFGEEIIATAVAEFVVSKGVPVKLPVATADQKTTYDSIVATLSSIESVLIDTASSVGFEFAVLLDDNDHEVYVSGYSGTPATDTKFGKLRVAPYTIINGEYYKVVSYSSDDGTAAIVNYGDVELPDTLYGIGEKAFSDVDMSDATLIIPKGVEYIAKNAFNFKMTSSVAKQKIVFESLVFPWSVNAQAFGTNNGVIEIYCSTEAYKDWKSYVELNYPSGRVVVVTDVDTAVLETELDDYQLKTDAALNTTAKTIVGAINENKAAISKEATDRVNADTSLSGKISGVEGSLNSEISNRENADATLQANIDNEATTRQNQINAANTEIGKKLDKNGGSISGNLAIQGNLTVEGTTTTENVEQLFVDEPVIVVNGQKANLQTVLAGLAINKNANATYGIMYDPATDTVLFGEGTVDANNHFTFNEGEGLPLAVRADSSAFTNAHLVKWNAEKNMFEDAGVAVSSFVEKQTGTTSYDQVYGKAKDGTQKMLNADGNASASTIVVRTGKGTIIANVATSNAEVVIKSQLDNAIASLDTKTDNKTITKNASGELQAVSLTDGTDILSYSDILQAMTIERL